MESFGKSILWWMLLLCSSLMDLKNLKLSVDWQRREKTINRNMLRRFSIRYIWISTRLMHISNTVF